MNEQPVMTIIYGSSRPQRLCDKVVAWVERGSEQTGLFRLQRLDPRQLQALPAEGEESAAAIVRRTLAASDAILMVTPEYNHSFPAPLKSVIDSAKQEWQLKPVSFVSYGGLSGGIRAVEQLRQVVVELHAVNARAAVALPNAWELFAESGEMQPSPAREAALTQLLRQLHWWAGALAQVRRQEGAAYADVA